MSGGRLFYEAAEKCLRRSAGRGGSAAPRRAGKQRMRAPRRPAGPRPRTHIALLLLQRHGPRAQFRFRRVGLGISPSRAHLLQRGARGNKAPFTRPLRVSPAAGGSSCLAEEWPMPVRESLALAEHRVHTDLEPPSPSSSHLSRPTKRPTPGQRRLWR